MKRKLSKLLCTVLCAALLLSLAGTASAAKTTSGVTASGIEAALADFYYVPSTVPEGWLDQPEQRVYLYRNNTEDSTDEVPSIYSATFKSGDEALKDAILFREDSYEENGEKKVTGLYISVDNSCLKAPGQAVFELLLESENMIFKKNFTLRVLDYNEYPLITPAENPEPVEAEPGDSWFESDFVERIGTYNEDAILKQLKIKPWNYQSWYVEPNHVVIEIPEEAERSGALQHYLDNSFWNFIYKVKVADSGSWDIQVGYHRANIRYVVPLRINAKGWKIAQDGQVQPGGTTRLSVDGNQDGAVFTWTMEGEGAQINAETGELAVDAATPEGTAFSVTATSDKGDEVKGTILVNSGILGGLAFSQHTEDGFSVPYPQGDEWYNDTWYASYVGYDFLTYIQNETMYRMVRGGVYYSDKNQAVYENPEKAMQIIEKDIATATKEAEDLEIEYLDLEGHPAAALTFRLNRNGALYAYLGVLMTYRNNRQVYYQVFSIPVEGQTEEDVPKVTMPDLKELAYRIRYNESKAPVSAKDAAMTLATKDGSEAVTAGKQAQVTVNFADPDKVNKKAKNDSVTWTVVNAETGEENPAATIKNGQVKIDKNLEAPVELEVRAVSDSFGTAGTLRLTAIPVAKGISVDPAEVFFYNGVEAEQTVKASIDPATVPLIGITWTAAKAGIVEITPGEDGTVTLKPVGSGKTTIAVKEPGGKNAKLNVSVVDPVTALELAVKGNAKPGGTVTVGATLTPKTAGNKNLEYSLDVGEDIATVSAKGQVKISKDAPAGTKITVTCKALGAPEPITATVEIEVAGK